MDTLTPRSKPKADTNKMIMRWFSKHYNLRHSSYAYIGMFGVWDMMGNNPIDQQVFLSGRTDHLVQMKETLCKAIDEELERRKQISDSFLI